MNRTINLAIQVLPLGIAKDKAYAVIDEAIKCINSSGLKYVVCPFETVLEGPYEDVMRLIDDIQEACRLAGAEEVLINMKLQRNFSKDVAIRIKLGSIVSLGSKVKKM